MTETSRATGRGLPQFGLRARGAGRRDWTVGRALAWGVSGGLAVLTTKCAACHQAGKLGPDQRFTLLDAKGNLAQLTDKQKARVLVRTYMKTMPPLTNSQGIASVTDEEYGSLVEVLAGN